MMNTQASMTAYMSRAIKLFLLLASYVSGFAADETSASPQPSKSPIKFSTRTEAAIALWNKSSPVPASNAFRIAMQAFENAATAFQEATLAVAPDDVLQTSVADAKLLAFLSAYKRTAQEMLAALHAYQRQEREELRLTRQPTEQQNEIIQKQVDSFRFFDEWGAAAIQAADAGLTVRSLIERGLPLDNAKLHFVETWNFARAIQESFVEKAQRHQKNTDELLRK